MSESIDWGIWLPVIGAVSGLCALCSIGIVIYCYCRVRDSLSPVGSGGGAAHVREQNQPNDPSGPDLSNAFSEYPPEPVNRTSSRVRFQGDITPTGFPRNRSQIVRIGDGQERTGKTTNGNSDEEVSFGTSGRGRQDLLSIEDEPQMMSRNDSRRRFGDTTSGGVRGIVTRAENRPVGSDGEGTGYTRDHIVDHGDGSQDVFV
jgi:hypothetical protein